ncbi:hypothetical protein [Halorarum salinum]|uniref:DUF8160 domain-containing protein n=1 Tax=Halorarum salinum TaxID=2743089 RepID=A0A7D5LE76_9EURY|nr:hypothetical protein [Halobaculum salinum]QLG64287.1 hypothetical protein HUG12_21130 [Halobaculum salinum]
MSGEDRASRLRNRRQQAKNRATGRDETDEPGEGAEQGETSKPSEPSESDEPAETGEPDSPNEADELDGEGSVKEEQVGTYMYLPRQQKKELERTYNLLKAEYEFEYDEEFEKNRHFFPLVVRHGLDTLAAADAEDVPDLLEDA